MVNLRITTIRPTLVVHIPNIASNWLLYTQEIKASGQVTSGHIYIIVGVTN